MNLITTTTTITRYARQVSYTYKNRVKGVLIMRVALKIQALAIREQDINWNGIDFANPEDISEPAGVKIRKE
jgi:hypothetical protein